jgi:drug/metabolite transporter (DMT)-like permease
MTAQNTARNTRLGILLMCLTSFVFAMQDGISAHLARNYNVWMVVTIRFWFFALFAIALVARQPGGLGVALRSRMPVLQVLRGVLLIVEICVMVLAFVKVGLLATQSLFISYPLMVAALSGPILGEKVGWRRWLAIVVGFVGVIVILNPGGAVFTPWAVVPLAAAILFAIYALLTRYVARTDAALTSFLWTGVVAAILITPVGLWMWEPMSPADWGWMGLLCCTASASHFMMIKAFELAEAGDVQPFALLQLVFVAGLAVIVFDETLETRVIVGTVMVVGAALFTLLRARAVARSGA